MHGSVYNQRHLQRFWRARAQSSRETTTAPDRQQAAGQRPPQATSRSGWCVGCYPCDPSGSSAGQRSLPASLPVGHTARHDDRNLYSSGFLAVPVHFGTTQQPHALVSGAMCWFSTDEVPAAFQPSLCKVSRHPQGASPGRRQLPVAELRQHSKHWPKPPAKTKFL